MKKIILSFLFYALIISCLGCSTQTNPPEERLKRPLNNVAINDFNTFKGKIYAATDEGLYRKEKTDTLWTSLGLQDKEVIDLVFLPGDNLLVVVRINNFSSGIPSLFLSTNQGHSWRPYMNDYGGDTDITWVATLEATSKPSDTLFAGASIMTAQSVNGGQSWKLLYIEKWQWYGGDHTMMEADPNHAGLMWFGGWDAIFLPFLVKSLNDGKTWEGVTVIENAEATPYDVITKPNDINVHLVSVAGVRKSVDGGETWYPVPLKDMGVYTFAHSASSSSTIYAAGRHHKGSLSFAVSHDFGDTWGVIEIEKGDYKVNDMISVMVNGKEVLYLGTNQGFYTYTLEK